MVNSKFSGFFIVFLTTIIFGILISYYHTTRVPITGDEPRYLLNSFAFMFERSIFLKEAYEQLANSCHIRYFCTENTTIYNAHIFGYKGDYVSIGGLGMGVLYALPLYFGEFFVRLLQYSMYVITIYYFASKFVGDIYKNKAVFSIIVISFLISQYGLLNSVQIYPEIPAGLCLIIIINNIFKTEKRSFIAFAVFTAILCTLHSRFIPVSILLIGAHIFYHLYTGEKTSKALLSWSLLPAISVALIITYNLVVFGSWTGFFTNSVFKVELDVVKRLLGFFFDANHGIIYIWPLSILFIYYLYVSSKKTAPLKLAILFVVVASIIVPLALTGYGGGSTYGRFSYTVLIVLLASILAARVQYEDKHRIVLHLLLFVGLYKISYFIVSSIIIGNPPIFNNINNTQNISGFAGEFAGNFVSNDWLLNRTNWYVLLLVAVAILLIRKAYTMKTLVVALFGVGILATLLTSDRQKNHFFLGGQLFSIVGHKDQDAIKAPKGSHGFLSFGPYISLDRGKYRIMISISADSKDADYSGYYDVHIGRCADGTKGQVLKGDFSSEKNLYTFDLQLASKCAAIEVRSFIEETNDDVAFNWLNIARLDENRRRDWN